MKRFKVQDWVGFAVAASILLLVYQNVPMPNFGGGGRHMPSPQRLAVLERAKQLLEEGEQARRAGNLTTAEVKLRASIKEDALFAPEAAKELAQVYEKEGRHQEALVAYKQAFNPAAHYYSDFPGDVDTLAQYGLLCEERGQWAEAVRVYNQARERLNPAPPVALNVDFDPKVPQPSRLRAMLCVVHGLALDEAGKSKDALAAFREAARLAPNEPLTQFYVGSASQKKPRDLPKSRPRLSKPFNRNR